MSAAELDPVFVKALHLLNSKSKDSTVELQAMLDDAIRSKRGPSHNLTNKHKKRSTITTGSKNSIAGKNNRPGKDESTGLERKAVLSTNVAVNTANRSPVKNRRYNWLISPENYNLVNHYQPNRVSSCLPYQTNLKNVRACRQDKNVKSDRNDESAMFLKNFDLYFNNAKEGISGDITTATFKFMVDLSDTIRAPRFENLNNNGKTVDTNKNIMTADDNMEVQSLEKNAIDIDSNSNLIDNKKAIPIRTMKISKTNKISAQKFVRFDIPISVATESDVKVDSTKINTIDMETNCERDIVPLSVGNSINSHIDESIVEQRFGDNDKLPQGCPNLIYPTYEQLDISTKNETMEAKYPTVVPIDSPDHQYENLYDGLDDNVLASKLVKDDNIFEVPDIFTSSNYQYEDLNDLDDISKIKSEDGDIFQAPDLFTSSNYQFEDPDNLNNRSENNSVGDDKTSVDPANYSSPLQELPKNIQSRKRLFAEIDNEEDLEEGELVDDNFSEDNCHFKQVKRKTGKRGKVVLGKRSSGTDKKKVKVDIKKHNKKGDKKPEQNEGFVRKCLKSIVKKSFNNSKRTNKKQSGESKKCVSFKIDPSLHRDEKVCSKVAHKVILDTHLRLSNKRESFQKPNKPTLHDKMKTKQIEEKILRMSPFQQKTETFSSGFCDQQSNFTFVRLDKYKKVAKIGEGTFGFVFKSFDESSGKIFALKKVVECNEVNNVPQKASQEVKTLQALNDVNIVNLLEISRQFTKHKTTFHLVLEFCNYNLADLLRDVNTKFCLGEIKMIVRQIFCGLVFIHSKNVTHGGMKTSNIMITDDGVVKLADVGLARGFVRAFALRNNKHEMNGINGLWYRSPECLDGENNSAALDLWGAGCIMAEFWTMAPVLQGSSESNQLTLIAEFFGYGSQTEQFIFEFRKTKTSSFAAISDTLNGKLKENLMPYIGDKNAIDLIGQLLALNPTERLNANSALNHDFFWTDPMPCRLAKMLDSYNSKKQKTLTNSKPDTSSQSQLSRTNSDNMNMYKAFYSNDNTLNPPDVQKFSPVLSPVPKSKMANPFSSIPDEKSKTDSYSQEMLSENPLSGIREAGCSFSSGHMSLNEVDFVAGQDLRKPPPPLGADISKPPPIYPTFNDS